MSFYGAILPKPRDFTKTQIFWPNPRDFIKTHWFWHLGISPKPRGFTKNPENLPKPRDFTNIQGLASPPPLSYHWKHLLEPISKYFLWIFQFNCKSFIPLHLTESSNILFRELPNKIRYLSANHLSLTRNLTKYLKTVAKFPVCSTYFHARINSCHKTWKFNLASSVNVIKSPPKCVI